MDVMIHSHTQPHSSGHCILRDFDKWEHIQRTPITIRDAHTSELFTMGPCTLLMVLHVQFYLILPTPRLLQKRKITIGL